jgi:pimeloyl-ACP methyl ester carboxylesterase
MKRLFRWLRYPVLVFTALLIAAGCANRVPKLPVPPNVTKRTEKLVLQGKEKPVDIYLPQNVERAPVVIVSHGFTRHRRVMAGWGILLAQHGMIAVVPTLPFFADQTGNSQAIDELIALVHEPGRIIKPSPNGDVALMGHSAGGFDTVLAASRGKSVRCWVGLDPVDFGEHGLNAIQSIPSPGLMLLAEPGAWNRHSNALPWLQKPAAPLTALRIHHSTHCDPENPSSPLADLLCGKTDTARRAVYERYVLAMLKQHLFGDAVSAHVLSQAAQDKAVTVLSSPAGAKVE